MSQQQLASALVPPWWAFQRPVRQAGDRIAFLHSISSYESGLCRAWVQCPGLGFALWHLRPGQFEVKVSGSWRRVG